MRLQFKDWTMEGGVVTERRASCGPLHYAVERDLDHAFGLVNSVRITPRCADLATAESACETHLQAILDAAAAMDAGRTTNA